MKKFLVVLLILAVAGGLFAQELKLTGYVNSGLQVNVDDSGVGKARAYGFDSNQNWYRARLIGAFSLENIGVNFRLQSNGAESNAVFFDYAYGYANLFDNMVKLFGGKIDNGTWNSMGVIDGDVGEGTGMLIQATPIPDLTFGMGMYAGTDHAKNDKGDAIKNGFGNNGVDMAYLKYTVGATYAMPDLFKFSSSFMVVNSKFSKSWTGLKLTMIPELTAVLEFGVDNPANVNSDGWTGKLGAAPMNITQKVAYDLGDLDVGLNAIEYINGVIDNQGKHNPLKSAKDIINKNEDFKFGFYVEPWVSYSFGKIVPQLAFKFGMYNSKNEAKIANYTLTTKTTEFVTRLKPSVKFNLAAGSFIELAYEWHMYDGSEKYSVSGSGGSAAADLSYDAQHLNRVYLDFVWKF